MRKYNMRYDQVIHPIPEYKVSRQGQISSNIICKHNKIKRSYDQVVGASGGDDASSGVAVVAS